MRIKMLKFMIIISILFILLFPLNATSKNILLINETIDQYQIYDDGGFWVDRIAWQEFKPQIEKLIKIELKVMSGGGDQPPLFLYIEKPLGTIIASLQVESSEIPNNKEWVTFDIKDINLDKGQSYFIKLSISPLSSYYWCGSNGDQYPDGISSKGSSWDWCFRTIVDKSTIKYPLIWNFKLFFNILK